MGIQYNFPAKTEKIVILRFSCYWKETPSEAKYLQYGFFQPGMTLEFLPIVL